MQRSLRSTLLAAGVTVLTAASLHAQSTRSYVQVVRLKPDMVTEWLNLQRTEVIPAQKKAGVTSRTTLVTSVGESFEYLIITPFPEWSAMDGDSPLVKALGAEGAAQLNAKLRRCILVQSNYMVNRQDSLSIPAADAPVWNTVIREFAPGKQAEYLAFYKREVLPALQKAKAAGKIAGSTLATRGRGAPAGEFVEVTLFSKFGDMQGANPLGAEVAAQLAQKSAALATTKMTVVRRRLADLSY
jgi:hypothetical protein